MFSLPVQAYRDASHMGNHRKGSLTIQLTSGLRNEEIDPYASPCISVRGEPRGFRTELSKLRASGGSFGASSAS